MTKRRILAIIIALGMCVLPCACSSEESNNFDGVGNVSYSDEITVSSEGSYFLFRTDSQTTYINFLESLDKQKYEIIDITIQPTTYYKDDCFMITYTKITDESQ